MYKFNKNLVLENGLLKKFWSKRSNKNLTLAMLICLCFLAVTGFILKNTVVFSIVGVLIIWLYLRFIYYQFFNGGEKSRQIWLIPLFSSVITAIIVSLAYYFIGMWPFGEKCALIVDMYHQYAPMLNYLRNMFLNGNDIFYSFNMGIGAGFISLFAYYLTSPLNVILALFPENLLTEGILLITIIKIALSAATFAIFLQYTFGKRHMAIPIVSIMYALSTYMLAYSWNIMWLDSIVMLPIVVACLEYFLRTGKFVLYSLALAFTLYLNYYIGFMICIFLVVYFIGGKICYACVQNNDCEIRLSNSLFRFVVASLIGAGLAMFLLMPTYYGLKVTSAAANPAELSEIATQTNFDLFEILGRNLFGVSPTIRSGGLPNIYCGILTAFLAILFLSNGEITKKRKFVLGGMLGLSIISFTLKSLDLVWHGLHAPNDLPYRFSFIYCFILLIMAYEVLVNIKSTTKKQVVMSLLAVIAYIVIEERFGRDDYGFIPVYVSLVFFAIYASLLYVYKMRTINVRSLYSLLLFVVTIEALFNTNYTLSTLGKNEGYTSHSSFLSSDPSYVINMSLDTLEEKYGLNSNEDFFRVETLPRLTLTDTALYNYPGITFFSSSNYYKTTSFLDALGYRSNGINSVSYRNFMSMTDSLLGVKYLVTNEASEDKLLEEKEQIQYMDNKYYIYENTMALPLGFMVSDDILSLDLLDADYKYDPFKAQNAIYSALLGKEVELYDKGATIELSEATNPSGASLNANSFLLDPQYKNTSYDFKVTANKGGNYYVYVDCGGATAIKIRTSSGTTSVSPRELYVVNVGELNYESIFVSITVDSKCSGNIYAVMLDDAVFSNTISTLSANALNIEYFNDSYIKGEISSKNGGVMFTSIPYDSSWNAIVDGKKVKTVSASESFLAVELKSGTHTIELKYNPKGFTSGLIVSILSLIIIIIAFLMEYIFCGSVAAWKVVKSVNLDTSNSPLDESLLYKEDFYEGFDDNTSV